MKKELVLVLLILVSIFGALHNWNYHEEPQINWDHNEEPHIMATCGVEPAWHPCIISCPDNVVGTFSKGNDVEGIVCGDITKGYHYKFKTHWIRLPICINDAEVIMSVNNDSIYFFATPKKQIRFLCVEY